MLIGNTELLIEPGIVTNLRHLEPEGDKMQVGWPVYYKLWDGIR